MIRIYRAQDYEAMSRRAAQIIAAQVALKPDCVLGLATGSTPVGTYRHLTASYKAGDLSFAQVKTINLDEYVGLTPDHPQSYRYFMQDNLFDHIDVKSENTNVPLGTAADPTAECLRYDGVIEHLGIDLQLLGIGHNGHIAFNEPDDAFSTGTQLIALTQSTIDANARFFDNASDVPRQALSMGMRGILSARRILIIASGAEKADILARAFTGPVTPQVPASILQLHPNVILVGDEAALSAM